MSIISKKMRQLTWYPCEKIAMNSDYFLQMINDTPSKQRLLAKGTQRSSKERDSNARRIRTTPWFRVGFLTTRSGEPIVSGIPQKIKQTNTPNPTFPNYGFMKVQRKNTTSEVTEGVLQHCNQLRMKLKARAIFAKRKSRTTPTLKPAFMPPMIST